MTSREALKTFWALVTEFSTALDRFEPSKVQINRYGAYCPTCGTILDEVFGSAKRYASMRYCSKCGQRLDWSEVVSE